LGGPRTPRTPLGYAPACPCPKGQPSYLAWAGLVEVVF